MNGAPVERSSGSLVVEALVAIGLLGVIGGSSLALLGAAGDARARSLERMVATWELRSELEASHGPLMASVEDVDLVSSAGRVTIARPVEVLIERDDLDLLDIWGWAGCAPPSLSGARSARLSAHGSRQDGPVASLESVRRLRGAGSMHAPRTTEAAAALEVQVADRHGDPLAAIPVSLMSRGFEVDDAPLHIDPPLTGTHGCAAVTVPGAGLHELWLPLEDHLDRFHRAVDERRIISLVPAARTRLRVIADTAATMTVSIQPTASALLPDHVDGGSLDWVLAGDGVAQPTDLESVRRVHPGRVDVLIGVCRGAHGGGTWSTATLGPGMHHDLVIVLPSLALPTLPVPPEGVRVIARRDSDCPGSDGVRPILTFEITTGSAGTVEHAPHVALPHGPWLVEVRALDGTRLYGPVRVQVTHEVAGG